jgi:predicted SAM-dependent methyltransferase
MRSLSRSIECPICGAGCPVLAHAVVAPFIAELVGLTVPTPVALRTCDGCDFSFFDGRFDSDQMAALYGRYRSIDYFKTRRHWEPWYSAGVNDAYTGNDAAVHERLTFMEHGLRESGVNTTFSLVVDFGGDEGQFIPAWPNARRVVCDVSDHPLPSEVERISTLSDLDPDHPDFVIIAHVLEHLVDPLGTMLGIYRSLAPGGTLYAEVPLDRPQVTKWHASIRYRNWLTRAAQHRPMFLAMDLAGGLSRQYSRRFPRIGALKESEHINYFNASSLRRLLETAGFSVLGERSDASAKVGSLRIGRLGMVAQKG